MFSIYHVWIMFVWSEWKNKEKTEDFSRKMKIYKKQTWCVQFYILLTSNSSKSKENKTTRMLATQTKIISLGNCLTTVDFISKRASSTRLFYWLIKEEEHFSIAHFMTFLMFIDITFFRRLITSIKIHLLKFQFHWNSYKVTVA